jgi:hypothetical protein
MYWVDDQWRVVNYYPLQCRGGPFLNRAEALRFVERQAQAHARARIVWWLVAGTLMLGLTSWLLL